MGVRIGILTGGGDCPGLNTVIGAVVRAAGNRGWETIGFLGGYEGLLAPVSWQPLPVELADELQSRGGTVLKTSNRGRFAAKVGHGEARAIPAAILDEARQTVRDLGLRALLCAGGDGSLSIAQQLFEHGVPVIGVPKTIDNDLGSTDMTFGFDTAVACATEALDRLRTTAESHDRVMVLEVMGRYAGWIALFAGVAGGADVILLPEVPFDWEKVAAKVAERERAGKRYTMVVVAEGARPAGGDYVSGGPARADGEARLGGVGAQVAEELGRRTGKESRACVLGHLQRGGTPTSFDRALCTLFGARAVDLAAEGAFGQMVALRWPRVVGVPIAEAVGQLRRVPPDGGMMQAARALGTSFGD